jgi:hypothetical protein
MTDVFIGEYSLAGISLTSVTPGDIEDDGGYELTILGLFKDATASVVLVDAGLVEYVCYSAKSGQGYSPRPRNPVTMIVASPPLPPGVYTLRVTQGVDSDEITNAVVVERHFWKTRTQDLRRLLPPWYKAGPRLLERIGLLETDLAAGPVINLAADIDAAFSFQLLSNNPLGVPLTWTSTGAALPGWLSLAASTGILSGMPDDVDAGITAGLQFRVDDGVQTADTDVFPIEVVLAGTELLTETAEILRTEGGDNLLLNVGV